MLSMLALLCLLCFALHVELVSFDVLALLCFAMLLFKGEFLFTIVFGFS